MINGIGDIDMGLVEKYLEIEKSHEEVCEQLYNKVRFIHENVGKDYRTRDCWFDIGVITDMREKDGFVRITYEYVGYEMESDDIFIKKELLDLSDEEILKNKDTLKEELETYNQEQLRQLEEFKKEKELETKKRECERLMAQVQKLESEIGK